MIDSLMKKDSLNNGGKKMKRAHSLLAAICLFFFLSQNTSLAKDVEIGGNVSHNLVFLLKENRLFQNVTHFKILLEKNFLNNKGKLHLSFKGDYDSIQDKELISLDKSYGDVYLKNTDLRIGRQIINWGTADRINPTNFITPRKFSLKKIEPVTEPIACFQGTYYNKGADVTTVIVFDNQFKQIPMEVKEKLRKLVPGSEDFPNPVEPKKTINNMEFALKVDTMLADNNIKFSYFHGWEDYPALWIEYEPGFPPHFNAKSQYRRVNKVGLSTVGTFEKATLWSELAYIMPERIEEMNLSNILFSMNKPYLQAVLGADYTFGDIYLEGQYIYYENGSLISPYFQYQQGEEVQPAHYFMISSYNSNWIRNWRLDSIVSLQDQSCALIPQYGFYISEATRLFLRGTLFFGNEDTEFGRLKDKESVSMSIKISF